MAETAAYRSAAQALHTRCARSTHSSTASGDPVECSLRRHCAAHQKRVFDLVARAMKIALIVFGIAIALTAVAAWLSGEQGPLPFEYEGFD